LLACALLTACGSVLDSGKPARQVYLLHTPSASASTTGSTYPNLLISVTAVPGLDSDRIMALGRDARLVPVANTHWPDHMPEVFTSIVRRYLSESRQFRSVQQGGIPRPGEWQLTLELQAFYGLLDNSGNTASVLLKMEGLVRCGGTEHVLRITEETGVESASLASLVAAHQRVLNAAMEGLPQRIIADCPIEDSA
jgi:ABC-type uncharacterized transport system auxiliary subunit